MRGNPPSRRLPLRRRATTRRRRSIPACAGEPLDTSQARSVGGVYPRVCGGTGFRMCAPMEYKGLSPRVRGNLPGWEGRVNGTGSIPACAGEPWSMVGTGRDVRVYPRVCGGTPGPPGGGGAGGGLSPRVRGNPSGRPPAGAPGGSIPACAGEPHSPPCPTPPSRVYPRVCGGTSPPTARASRGWGLSPRVRGNHGHQSYDTASQRSIPACAGEPLPSRPGCPPMTVYPRVCGGTAPTVAVHHPVMGLSPRVRGNLEEGQYISERSRSIPACAGEPCAAPAVIHAAQVYPRVCGGTPQCVEAASESWGLSPRVRGNLIYLCQIAGGLGSIPACAGEPGSLTWTMHADAVYPRVCGGTPIINGLSEPEYGLSPRVRGNP